MYALDKQKPSRQKERERGQSQNRNPGLPPAIPRRSLSSRGRTSRLATCPQRPLLPPSSLTRTGKGKWQMADAAGLIRAGGARGEISSRQSARPPAGVSWSSFARRLDVASSSRDCHSTNSHVESVASSKLVCWPGWLVFVKVKACSNTETGLQGTNIVSLNLIHTLFWYRQRNLFLLIRHEMLSFPKRPTPTT